MKIKSVIVVRRWFNCRLALVIVNGSEMTRFAGSNGEVIVNVARF